LPRIFHEFHRPRTSFRAARRSIGPQARHGPDCRLLRADNGQVYSLSSKLPRLENGDRVCLRATLTKNTGCMHAPMIEVSEVFSEDQCP